MPEADTQSTPARERSEGAPTAVHAGQIAAVAQPASSPATQIEQRRSEHYLSFFFYKTTPELTKLVLKDRQHLAWQFKDFIAFNRARNKYDIRLFSCKGYRANMDCLIWLIADSFQAANNFYTGFERKFFHYFNVVKIFHGRTRPSDYFKQERLQQFQLGPCKCKYLFVYPFAKTAAWYQEPKEKRIEMMKEHRTVATKFERVYTNTVYSYGLGDDEFLLAFETDYPGDFAELLIALREIKVRPYTLYDTPIIPCINKPEPDFLNEIFLL